jgi:hypothetical protein
MQDECKYYHKLVKIGTIGSARLWKKQNPDINWTLRLTKLSLRRLSFLGYQPGVF